MITGGEAAKILRDLDARRDYHTLPSSTVDKLVEIAKARGYRKSKDAPGSYARMFHTYLSRRALSSRAWTDAEFEAALRDKLPNRTRLGKDDR